MRLSGLSRAGEPVGLLKEKQKGSQFSSNQNRCKRSQGISQHVQLSQGNLLILSVYLAVLFGINKNSLTPLPTQGHRSPWPRMAALAGTAHHLWARWTPELEWLLWDLWDGKGHREFCFHFCPSLAADKARLLVWHCAPLVDRGVGRKEKVDTEARPAYPHPSAVTTSWQSSGEPTDILF